MNRKEKPKNTKVPNSNFLRSAFLMIIIFLGLIWISNLFRSDFGGLIRRIPYGEFYSYLEHNLDKPTIKSVKMVDNLIQGVFTESSGGGRFYVYIPQDDKELLALLKKNVPEFEIEPPRTFLSNLLFSLAPIIIFIVFLWYFSYKGSQMGARVWGFGKSRARLLDKENTIKVTFGNVAGIDEAKAELEEVIEFLKDPKKFQRLGGRFPKGVLLVGPPGCGKTLLAKAVAGEAKVPFYSISGSDFVEMFVGVGASVSFDTPVLIESDEETKLVTISEFVDKFYPGDNHGYMIPVKGVQTLGYESKECMSSKAKNMFFGASKWQDIKGVFRHKANEIYEIHYLGGVIKTTSDHSIFVRDKNRIVCRKAEEIKPGDMLVNLPFKVRGRFVPSKGTLHFVRAHKFPNYLPKELTVWQESLELKENYDFALQQKGLLSQSKIAQLIGVSPATVGLWQRSLTHPRYLSDRAVPSRNNLPQKVKVTNDFLKLLGYYTAEGRRTEYMVEFVFGIHEKYLHSDCINLMQTIFNLFPNLEETSDNTLRISYYSKELGNFFERYCGNGSHHKHIPSFLWDSPKEYFLNYLDGLVKGDGYTTKEGKLSLSSVSKQLILELSWLCALHGIGIGLREGKNKGGRVIKNKPLPEGEYYNLIIGKTSNPFGGEKLSSQFKKSVVEKVVKKPYSGFVYDLCGCENEAFFGGDKPTLLHNSRVRDLFEQAKKAAKMENKGCIIFIDEIDAVGRQRFAGIGGGHDEREQTLNQLLTEMDGFQTEIGIIVMAATNRPDVLDAALLRPGRFDRHIVIYAPDIQGREAILKVHTCKIHLAKEVDLKAIAQKTPGFSGADLESLCNEAALLAARYGKEAVEQSELEESIERVMMGPEKKSRVISKHEKELTAYHEAGHALLSLLVPEVDPLAKVSIIPRGMVGGYTFTPPREDRWHRSKKELLGTITVMLGGRVSEEVNLGDITTGASDDLVKVTQLARQMVCDYGMSERLGSYALGRDHGPIFLGRDLIKEKDYSEETAKIIDEEVKRIVDECYAQAKRLIDGHKRELKILAEALFEKEVLDAQEVKRLIGFTDAPR